LLSRRAVVLLLLGATLLGLTALPVLAASPVGRWTSTGSLSKPRDFHTATRLGDGSVLVAGGTTGGPATVKAERFDPGAGTWAPTGSLTTARESHTATLLAGAVAFQMHVAVDQAGQDIALAQVDDGRAGITLGRSETVADRFDPAVADDDRRRTARLLAWAVQQAACVDEDEGVGGLREGCAGGKGQQGE